MIAFMVGVVVGGAAMYFRSQIRSLLERAAVLVRYKVTGK